MMVAEQRWLRPPGVEAQFLKNSWGQNSLWYSGKRAYYETSFKRSRKWRLTICNSSPGAWQNPETAGQDHLDICDNRRLSILLDLCHTRKISLNTMIFPWVFDVWGVGSLSSHTSWKTSQMVSDDANSNPGGFSFPMLYVSKVPSMTIYMDKTNQSTMALDQAREEFY